MPPISLNKLLLYPERIEGNQKPVTADIFLTNYCNSKCAYCRYRHNDGSYMPFELFKSVVNRLRKLGVLGVILTGGGEPTINPDFAAITNWLEDECIPYGINTNFIVYKECSPSFLKISLDASDEYEYLQGRGVNKYRQVIENIEEYCRFRLKVRNRTVLGLQCVVRSVEDIERFYSAHRELLVDYFSFRPLETGSENYTTNELDRIKRTINDLSCNDSRILFNYKWKYVNRPVVNCPANWSVLSVLWDGNVVYCCHKPDEIVGSIFDDDILSKKDQWVTDFDRCDVPCRLSGPNDAVSSYPPLHREFI